MSKSKLGRGLGELLGTERAAPQTAVSGINTTGVGLRILIKGASGELELPGLAEPHPIAPPPASPATSIRESDGALVARLLTTTALIGADLGLLSWPAHYVYTHLQAATALGLTACVTSVVLAATCGCAAALICQRPD